MSDDLNGSGGRARAGDMVWSHAREAYSLGASGPDVCTHYGLPVSTFRKRARREGWRRGDLSDDPGAFHAEDATVHETMDAETLAERAWRAASEAVRLGRLSQAQGWTRLAETYRRLAAEEREARERHDGGPASPLALARSAVSNARREARMARMARLAPDPESATREREA
jgi:hypothetical protein